MVLPSLEQLGSFEGTEAGAHLGRSLALADLDRDGKLDMVAGAPDAPGGSAGGSGRVIVSLTSSPAGAIGAPSFATRFGESVATGDVDGDGALDIVVGAPGGGEGAVYTFDAQTGRQGPTFTPPIPGSYGFKVAVGDVDGDGRDDIVASSPSALDGAGRITVNGNLSVGTGTFSIDGAPGEGLGSSLALADFDLDGKLDIVAGARFVNNGGVVIVLDGGRAVVKLVVRTTNEQFVLNDLAAGDLNGDGYPDIVVGAPGASNGDGRVSAIDGRTHTFLWDTAADLGSAGGLGASVAIGDLNGDGFPEVAAGAPAANEVVVLEATQGRNITITASDSCGNARGCGAAIAVGDLDADGIADLAIGAPLTDVEDPSGTPMAEAGAIEMLTMARKGVDADSPRIEDFAVPADSFVTLSADPAPGTALLPGPSFVWASVSDLA